MSDATRWNWGSQGMTKHPEGLFVTYDDADSALMTTVMKLFCCANCGNRTYTDNQLICNLNEQTTPPIHKCDNWIFSTDETDVTD